MSILDNALESIYEGADVFSGFNLFLSSIYPAVAPASVSALNRFDLEREKLSFSSWSNKAIGQHLQSNETNSIEYVFAQTKIEKNSSGQTAAISMDLLMRLSIDLEPNEEDGGEKYRIVGYIPFDSAKSTAIPLGTRSIDRIRSECSKDSLHPFWGEFVCLVIYGILINQYFESLGGYVLDKFSKTGFVSICLGDECHVLGHFLDGEWTKVKGPTW